MLALRSPGWSIGTWLLRGFVAIPLLFGAAWVVARSIPEGVHEARTVFTVVATAVFVAGLAVEELIGNDVRSLLDAGRSPGPPQR